MARSGRKRNFAGFNPGSTQSKLNALNAREVKKARAHVTRQPHRRTLKDPEHPWAVSALGRLCLRHGLHEDLHEAAQEYATLIHRWRAAKGIPAQGPAGEGMRGDFAPSLATVRAWEAFIERVEGLLERQIRGLPIRMRILLLDDLDLPREAEPGAIEGLQIIGVETGLWVPQK